MKRWWIIVLVSLLLMAGAFAGGWYAGRGRIMVQRDTVTSVVTFRDTVRVVEPREVVRTVVRRELVAVTDTVRVNDTTFVSLPVERREYRDSNYYAVVSGIRPSLDEIAVFPETRVVTQTITQTVEGKKRVTRFGIGLQAGFGAQYGLRGRQFDAGPYVGVGVSYNFARF